MEPEPIYNNVKYEDIINNINIPTEEQLLNTLFNKNNNEDYIQQDVKPSSSGNYNNVRFHKIKDTNSIITYRESISFIYQYFYSNRQTKELHNDLSISFKILHELNLESNRGKRQDYENVNNFFNKTIQNNIRASTEAIAPQLYFAGFVKKEVSSGVAFHFVIISEAFDMDLYTYYNNKKYKGYHNRQANLISKITSDKFKLFEDDEFIRDSLVELLDDTVYKLNIVCFDIKPGNCVINLNEEGEITDIRLIDWDSNYCIHDENLKNNSIEQETIFCINLIFMSIHFLRYSNYNIFVGIMEIEESNIKTIQNYICNDDAKYMTIYKLFLRDYFKGNYNYGDIKKCKDIVSSLITESNKFLSLQTGGKKKLKQIFKQKTNKKTRKNRSKKNKTKKGGRMENPNPNNHNTILEELSIEQPRIFSAEYQSIMNIIDMPNLDSNSFSQPFIKLYFILYDNLQKESIVEQLDDDELNIIFLQFILLFCHNEMTDNEKRRVREFFLQNDDDYSVILKLNDDQRDIEMQHKFPDRIIEKLHEKRDLFASYLES